MSEKIKVTKEIPKPPDGWQWEDRHPISMESHLRLVGGGLDWVGSWNNDRFSEIAYEFAYRIPKKKRLMTPQELAGKWICWVGGGRSFISSFSDTHVWPGSANQGSTPKKLHETGDKYSDTPTSEPKPLEIEE